MPLMNSRRKIYSISVLILSSFLGCQQDTTTPNIEKAITDLTEEFTQLPKCISNPTDFYKLVRSVTMGESNVQLQLRNTPDSVKDKQQIIIIIDPKGKYYAIPFFSNTYRDYWNFKLDKPIPGVKKTNTTFEHELNKALDTLNLNDTLGTRGEVITEILISLLNCDKVSDYDSSRFVGIFPVDNYSIPAEELDSCYVRLRRNFIAIRNEIHPSENYRNYNAYWDQDNGRIYQINNQGRNWEKKQDLQITVYRQDCVIHAISM